MSLAELHDKEWIVPTRDSATYRAVLKFFRDKKLPVPEHVIESVSILTNLELIVQWNMVSIMPSSAARRFEELGLVKVLAFDHLSEATSMGYTIRADREQSVIVQSFIQALRESSGGV